MRQNFTIVTTSWDDGDPADLRLAELLGSRGLRGTFYIPNTGYDGRPTLDPAALRTLAADGHEVGAHGVTHRTLPTLGSQELAREVRDCKSRLEDILGSKVPMFCYPKGRYNKNVIRALKAAGYEGARTTRMLALKLDFDPFEMPTSLQVYPHTRSTYLRNVAKARNIGRLYDYMTQFMRVESWVELGKVLFEFVLREGGIFHLYGHSWEIEELGLWDDLGEMLDYVSRRDDVVYVSNAEMLKELQPEDSLI